MHHECSADNRCQGPTSTTTGVRVEGYEGTRACEPSPSLLSVSHDGHLLGELPGGLSLEQQGRFSKGSPGEPLFGPGSQWMGGTRALKPLGAIPLA